MKLTEAQIHFIGIGGIGMCGLAEVLHNLGARVSGSDAQESANTARLRVAGVKVFIGHDPKHVDGCDVVVYSSAVNFANVEYQAAIQSRIPLIRRAEALADIMKLKRGIAVAGTHGKTTTTSLVSSIFLNAGLDPTIVVGGRLSIIESTAQLGQGEWVIAEADESDGSFTHLSPEIVIITNIDTDHLDHYKSIENLTHAFFDFASRIPFYGKAIICGDDERLRTIFQRFGKRWVSYGLSELNDYRLIKEKSEWTVARSGQKFGLKPSMPGTHNALNALAACIAAESAGVDFSQAVELVTKFKGVDRRFQHKGEAHGVDFFDDYGHHPTEIRAVLQGVKERYPDRRLVTVFQPHRYSRTHICWSEFEESFKDTDLLYVLDIYAAGEDPITGVDASRLASQIDHSKCQYLSRAADPQLSSVIKELKPGDVLLTLGAGDISKIGEKLFSDFSKSGSAVGLSAKR